MNVLSLFDGISCGRVALEKAGIIVDKYYASEIDQYAIWISSKNYPDIEQIGDVTNIKGNKYKGIDLLIGGSPCQGFSFAGKQLNFIDPRSRLFFEYVRVLEEVNPKFFLLENVKMKQEYQDTITRYLGVKPIEINSALVSAQNRKRLYWTNIPNVTQPEDKKLMLKHIVEPEIDKKDFDITERMKKKKPGTLSYEKAWKNVRSLNEKSKTLLTGQSISNSGATNIKYSDSKYYKPTPIECERLQTLPDNYTEGISNTQRYKCIGNGWTVDVIAHIFKECKYQVNENRSVICHN